MLRKINIGKFDTKKDLNFNIITFDSKYILEERVGYLAKLNNTDNFALVPLVNDILPNTETMAMIYFGNASDYKINYLYKGNAVYYNPMLVEVFSAVNKYSLYTNSGNVIYSGTERKKAMDKDLIMLFGYLFNDNKYEYYVLIDQIENNNKDIFVEAMNMKLNIVGLAKTRERKNGFWSLTTLDSFRIKDIAICSPNGIYTTMPILLSDIPNSLDLYKNVDFDHYLTNFVFFNFLMNTEIPNMSYAASIIKLIPLKYIKNITDYSIQLDNKEFPIKYLTDGNISILPRAIDERRVANIIGLMANPSNSARKAIKDLLIDSKNKPNTISDAIKLWEKNKQQKAIKNFDSKYEDILRQMASLESTLTLDKEKVAVIEQQTKNKVRIPLIKGNKTLYYNNPASNSNNIVYCSPSRSPYFYLKVSDFIESVNGIIVFDKDKVNIERSN